MAGDYTSVAFKPRKDISAVFMQQGKVQLDADWNHLVDMFARRFRVETADIIGRCAYPTATGNGFKVSLVGAKLMIARGRLYVDGLLAENHGVGAPVYEPIWSEETGQNDVDYDQQPYFTPPDPPAAKLPGGQKHLLYLDVFERELTAVEQPDMVEKALGIDTATRLQTAWQVKALQNVGDMKCDSDWSKYKPWTDLTAPSAGRLTATATPVPDPGDPCVIPPKAGYRGVENRLYRVEIHTGGGVGTATFKWSRDNGAVAAVITGISDPLTVNPKIKVTRIGRDPMLRFKANQWVELIDDQIELAGKPGLMAQVFKTDEVNNVIVLHGALPSATPVDMNRNPRIRRWDQPSAPVTIDDLTKQFAIELGISVQFGLDAGIVPTTFHTGDYWVFWARSIDGTVEPLVQVPPRGVRHHFCGLALYTPGQQPEDCRTPWPPPFGEACGDCTVCVTPESHAAGVMTIQAAVDKVKTTGGKVCLAPGIYKLERKVQISGTDIHVVGKGWQTIVYAVRDEAFRIQSALDVSLEDMTIATVGIAENSIGVVAIRNALGTAVRRCNVVADVGQILIDATASSDVETRLELSAASTAIGLDALVLKTDISDNVLIAAVGVGWPGSPAVRFESKVQPVSLRDDATGVRVTEVTPPPEGKSRYLFTFDLGIHDNTILARRRGVDFASRLRAPIALAILLGSTAIRQNDVYGAAEIGVVVSGFVPDAQIFASTDANREPLLNLPSGRLDIASNLVVVSGYGVCVGSDRARIVGNDIAALASRSLALADGIVLHRGMTYAALAHDVAVRGNVITGFGGYGIAPATYVLDGAIEDNTVHDVDWGGIVMDPIGRNGGDALKVVHNIVYQVGMRATQEGLTAPVSGIQLNSVSEASITDNVVAAVGIASRARTVRSGIRALGCDQLILGRNEVGEVGPRSVFETPACGIDVEMPARTISVTENSVSLTLKSAEGQLPRQAIRIATADITLLPLLVLHLILAGILVPVSVEPRAPVRGLPRIMVKANHVDTYSSIPAVRVDTSANCLFGDNMCHEALSQQVSPEGFAVVVLHATGGGSAIATSNYIECDREEYTPLDIVSGGAAADAAEATVLGNVTLTGRHIRSNGADLGAPWDALNKVM